MLPPLSPAQLGALRRVGITTHDLNLKGNTMTNEAMQEISYSDEARIREVLVGRRIVEVRKSKGVHASSVRYDSDYGSTDYDHIEFVLDNGTILEAVESDGCCACSNGCFSVANPEQAHGTILNAEVQELAWDYETANNEKPVTPGSVSDGSSTIRIFVYTELGKTNLIESEGGDNGYYGWGFGLFVKEVQS